jgi:hypothetical protein
MHRSSKRIVAPLFLLLAAAVIFVPEVRADELLNFSYGDGTWTWTMAADATPDQGSVAANDFTFLAVPTFSRISETVQTFDLHFFRLPGMDTTDLIQSCDPFRIVFDPINQTCDYFNRIEVPGIAMWSVGADGNPVFIPGDYNGLIISATPEPSTLALLLMSFATLFLLAVGRRPSDR